MARQKIFESHERIQVIGHGWYRSTKGCRKLRSRVADLGTLQSTPYCTIRTWLSPLKHSSAALPHRTRFQYGLNSHCVIARGGLGRTVFSAIVPMPCTALLAAETQQCPAPTAGTTGNSREVCLLPGGGTRGGWMSGRLLLCRTGTRRDMRRCRHSCAWRVLCCCADALDITALR